MLNNTGIWVVIPNWNGADLILECLGSLANQTQPHTVIVVDNGSTDNSIALIEKQYPNVLILKNKVNLGFAGGVNVGITYALKQNAEYVALFNNDAVAESSWLKLLVVAAEKDAPSGIVTGKLLRSDHKKIDSTGECYSIWGMPFPRARDEIDDGAWDNSDYVFGASGGASLYRAKMLEQIGIFDKKFFAYYEDSDISWRAQLAGWKVLYEPRALAYHKISATSSRHGNFTRYHATKNFYILYFKNMPGYLFYMYLPLFIIKALALFASSLVKAKPHVWFKGFFAFLILLPAVLRDRRRIQKHRRVPISYVRSLLTRRLL